MDNLKNTVVKFSLANGEEVGLTLTFRKLNLMKSVNSSLYTRFNKIMTGKSEEILDLVTVIYGAYWCQNYGAEEMLTESDFIDLVPFDINEIRNVFRLLTQPKKKQGSGSRS